MKNRTLSNLVRVIVVCLLVSGCGEDPFIVKGNVLGLTGSVDLILDGGETLKVNNDGEFQIGSQVPNPTYSLAILNHPEQQTCLVTTKGTGAVPEGDGNSNTSIIVEGVEINCVDGWKGTRQWGTNQNDQLYAAALDSSDNIHMVGTRWESRGYHWILNELTSTLEYIELFKQMGWLSRLNGSEDVLLEADGDAVFRSIVIDDMGNSYIVGSIEGDWDDQINQGGSDVLITKLDARGEFLWTRLLGGSGYDSARDVALNAAGQLFVVGRTSSDEFEGNTRIGNFDGFVMQLDTDGNIGWVSLLGTTTTDYLTSVTVDNLGDVIVTGTSQGDFAGASNNGSQDIVVAKYDTTGEQQWLTMVGGDRNEMIGGLTIDSENNIILGGSTRSDIFYGQARLGGTDVIIVKLDSDGDLLSSSRMGSVGIETIRDIIEDSEGNLVFTGQSNNSDWSGPSLGSFDAYIMKLDSSDTQLWVEKVGSSLSDSPNFLLKDSAENYFMGGVTEDSLPGFINVDRRESTDAFLAKFDSDGNIL